MKLRFPHRETWVHRLNPTLKLAVFFAMFIMIVLIHNFNVMLNVTLGTLVLLALGSGHPWKRLLLYASPFVLIFISTATGMMMFGQGSTTWFQYGLVHVTEESFYRGLHLGCRALTLAATGLLFGLTTRPSALFYSLMQQCRLSPKYAYGFMAGIRMLPAVLEEFMIRRQALKVRGGLPGSRFGAMYAALKAYSIPLLAQSIRRAQRVAVAMQAKRFDGSRERTHYYEIGFHRLDSMFLLGFAAFIATAIVLGYHVPYIAITDVREI